VRPRTLLRPRNPLLRLLQTQQSHHQPHQLMGLAEIHQNRRLVRREQIFVFQYCLLFSCLTCADSCISLSLCSLPPALQTLRVHPTRRRSQAQRQASIQVPNQASIPVSALVSIFQATRVINLQMIQRLNQPLAPICPKMPILNQTFLHRHHLILPKSLLHHRHPKLR